jgi:hypothetical protein
MNRSAVDRDTAAARQNAQRAFDRNATPQERQQASRMNQQARSDVSQDRADPNRARESAQANQLGRESRNDFDRDRFSGDRFGGGRSFGGGHFGGFRR